MNARVDTVSHPASSRQGRASGVWGRLWAYVKLLRPLTLLQLAVIVCSARWGVLFPLLRSAGIPVHTPMLVVVWIAVAVLLLAASAFAFNDYHDRHIDAANPTRKHLLGTTLHRSTALMTYTLFSIGALIAGLISALAVHRWWLALLFPLAGGLLWFYSTVYRRIFLLNHMIIALLVALLPVVLLVYELYYLDYTVWAYVSVKSISVIPAAQGLLLYAAMLLVVKFTCEVIRSMRNFVAEQHLDCDTLPVRYGLRNSAIVVIVLALCAGMVTAIMGMQLMGQVAEAQFGLSQWAYTLLLLVLPAVGGLATMQLARNTAQYSWALRLWECLVTFCALYPFILLHG